MIFYTITIVYIFYVFFPRSADMSFLQEHISFYLGRNVLSEFLLSERIWKCFFIFQAQSKTDI